MRGNEEVGDVGGVHLSGDSVVVAGGARVFEDSSAIGCDPDETEDGSVEGWGRMAPNTSSRWSRF